MPVKRYPTLLTRYVLRKSISKKLRKVIEKYLQKFHMHICRFFVSRMLKIKHDIMSIKKGKGYGKHC